MQYAPTRVRAKFGGFHISAHIPAQNAPHFTLPNRDRPKTRPILDPNRRRGTFRGVCFCAPTRVREKFGGFHISAYGYAKNAPDFTLPDKDTLKTCPVLDPNLRRRTFQGVCNTPLHGYVHNLSGFTFPHPNTPKTHPILPSPIRIRPKPRPVLGANPCHGAFRGVCNTPLYGYVQNLTSFRRKPSAQDISGRMLLHPYTGTCKIWRVLNLNHRRGYLRGVCNTPLHGYVKNPADFRPKFSARGFWGRMLLRPYTGACKIWRVSHFPIRMHPKPVRF